MIENTKIIRTRTLDPWWNLAVEEYLLDRVGENECILYLWQNQNTVVIGKNQNAWRECRTELLEKEGGKLARRLSGGGAVFHDTGNLNFTFLMNKGNYNLEKQVSVILKAVQKVDIKAEMSGRNDLTVDGKKFSGNAFCFRKSNAYHHGTILVSADMEKMTRYLQVSKEKIKSKGIESVQSRVVNLASLNTSLTIDKMADAVAEAFKEVYGGSAEFIEGVEDFDQNVLKGLYEKYSSWDWRYGQTPKFDIEMENRFPWGGIELGLKLEKGRIQSAFVYSDAMDEAFISMIPDVLKDCEFKSSAIYERIKAMNVSDDRRQFVEDIANWLLSKGF